jgi:hypothetical protein
MRRIVALPEERTCRSCAPEAACRRGGCSSWRRWRPRCSCRDG